MIATYKAVAISGVILIFASSSLSIASKVYRWVDENGVVGFTDNLSGLPEKYLRTVTPYADTEPGERATVLEETRQPQADEKSDFPEDLDSNGRDETWWKNRVKELKARKEVLLQEKLRLQQEYDTKYAIWLNVFAPGNNNIGEINKQINAGKVPNPALFFGLPIPEPEIAQSQEELKNQIAQTDADLSEIGNALEVVLPDEARKAGAPPGWLRN